MRSCMKCLAKSRYLVIVFFSPKAILLKKKKKKKGKKERDILPGRIAMFLNSRKSNLNWFK